MSVQWNNPNIHVAKSSQDVEVKIWLTANELVKIVCKLNKDDLVEVIGEILANYDIEVTQKVGKLIKEWSE